MINQALFDVLKCALWGSPPCYVEASIFQELRLHAVATLPAGILSQLKMPDDVRQQWQSFIYRQISYNVNYKQAQVRLPITVPYVILKGSAAAKYYPNPQFRAMGDIDIMTRREDCNTACEELLAAGYKEILTEANILRHREFRKDGILVEVHYYFASLNDPKQAKYLDDLIINSITPIHYLPDMVNGLVLLEHISQHLEKGLGLRQIVDWMMFVNKCLTDEKWHEFETLSQNIGLETLAIVVTRMCEIYLGLPVRNWCTEADEKLCEQLMKYIMDSGNFGNKRTGDEATIERVFAYSSTLKATFSLLQERGLVNWKATHKHRFLRPFAWIYQGVRYLKKGLKQDNARKIIKVEYNAAKEKNAMLNMLGVRTRAKGIVRFKNGKYIK